MRIIYSEGGHGWRDVTPAAVDVRDLVGDRPHPSLLAVGDKIGEISDAQGQVTHHLFDHVEPTRLLAGEKQFDHVLSPAEIEREFPGYAARNEQRARLEAVRAAAAHAAHDDELARLVEAGVIASGELDDLAAINARLALRGRPALA